MKITLFTSNQPRHLHLAAALAQLADDVNVICEVNTVFPGKVQDFFKKSDVMQRYFGNVIAAERRLFGDIRFLPGNARILAIKHGDLNLLEKRQLADALEADLYVVFGASYIRGWLVDFLVDHGAINIHMGISPYYRGSSCNFWALYDDRPGYVGATIHMLSKGLDSGDMLFHCLPRLMDGDSPFDFTMRAVAAAHHGLCRAIRDGSIFEMERVKQDRTKEIRYTRNADFTDEVAEEFLRREYVIEEGDLVYPDLLHPIFY
ncbi:MAG: methionyl-tRNA formyltransferase [Verrucomicrobia bacterium]|nr:MAG: methionyl-tRNA formyltransferase [Verrucomicrobiota bacterium]